MNLKEKINNNYLTENDLKILSLKHDYTKYHIINEWIKMNPKKALLYRGKYSETLLHWSILNNLETSKNLIEYIGIDVNQEDKNGNTPFDWLLERYFINVILNTHNMIETGRIFLLNQTNKHAIYLYNKQAKTKFNVIDLFSKSGSYEYIDYIFRKKSIDSLINLTDIKKSIIHNWILLGESIEKHQKLIEILENYKIDIDIQDIQGRTPLYYAIDGWITKPELTQDFWIPTIKSLLRNKANPFKNSYNIYNINKKEIINLTKKEIEEAENNIKNDEIILSPYNLLKNANSQLFEEFSILIEEANTFLTSSNKEKEEILKTEYDRYFKLDKGNLNKINQIK